MHSIKRKKKRKNKSKTKKFRHGCRFTVRSDLQSELKQLNFQNIMFSRNFHDSEIHS